MKVTLEDGREILTIRVDGEGTNLTEEEALEIVKNYISNREKERKAKKQGKHLNKRFPCFC